MARVRNIGPYIQTTQAERDAAHAAYVRIEIAQGRTAPLPPSPPRHGCFLHLILTLIVQLFFWCVLLACIVAALRAII